jgi:hypothetical protein
VPPRFSSVRTLVAVDGVDKTQDRLATGEREAYALNLDTGEMSKISREGWRAHTARGVLEEGFWTRYRSGGPYGSGRYETFIVVVADKPPEQTRPALPRPAEGDEKKTLDSATAAWAAGEASRMKKAGEIPPDIRITNFAQKLADRMKKAAEKDRSIRPVGKGHIKNMLPKWGLWPISLIK